MDKARKQTDQKLAEIERATEKIYQRTGIDKRFEQYAETIDSQANELLKAIETAEDMAEKRKAKQAYIKFINSVIASREFKALSKQTADTLYDLNVKASDYINGQLPYIYALNYNFTNERLAGQIKDFVADEIDEQTADEYADLTKQGVDKKKDTIWNKKNIANSVLSGAILGLAVKKIFSNTAKIVVDKNVNVAKTHASGMVTDSETKGRLDGMYRAQDMGIVVKKQWVAIKDNRTRDSHARLDGKQIDLDKEFSNGLQRPRDPNGRPEEVCNCRCALIEVVPKYFKPTTTVARKGEVTGSYKKSSSWKNTQTIEIENMTYQEWAKWRKSKNERRGKRQYRRI